MANQVHLRGNTTRDPNVFRAPHKTPVAFLHIAADSLFTSVICFGEERVAQAERLGGKGSPIELVGRLRTNTTTDADGTKSYRLEVVADDIRVPQVNGPAQQAPAQSAPVAVPETSPEPARARGRSKKAATENDGSGVE